jgi:hypothetical protein
MRLDFSVTAGLGALSLVLSMVLAGSTTAIAGSAEKSSGLTPSPAGARVFIISPKDGATVQSPVMVKLGAEKIEVAKAGSNTPNSGHHHLIVDSKLPDLTKAIPKDDTHIHLGAGETEIPLLLLPGKHTLQDLFGDKNHIPHDPPLKSEKITITVEW